MGTLLRDLKQQVDAAKPHGASNLSPDLVQWFEHRYSPADLSHNWNQCRDKQFS